MFRITSRRAYNTIKSKNDEQNNLQLLQMLKKIPALDKRVVKNKVEKEKNETRETVSLGKIDKILKLFLTDPLTWNVSTLSRIFKLPEDYCKNLVENVQPMTRYASNRVDEPVKLIKVAFVVDLARFKSDKTYMPTYQRLSFVESDVKLGRLSNKPALANEDEERH